MTLISRSGKKAIKISYSVENGYRATLIQYFNEGDRIREQVLSVKNCANHEKAVKYAKKELGI